MRSVPLFRKVPISTVTRGGTRGAAARRWGWRKKVEYVPASSGVRILNEGAAILSAVQVSLTFSRREAAADGILEDELEAEDELEVAAALAERKRNDIDFSFRRVTLGDFRRLLWNSEAGSSSVAANSNGSIAVHLLRHFDWCRGGRGFSCGRETGVAVEADSTGVGTGGVRGYVFESSRQHRWRDRRQYPQESASSHP